VENHVYIKPFNV